MTLVKFVGNSGPNDNTGAIRLSDGRTLVRGGETLDIEGEDLKQVLGSGVQIELVEQNGSPPSPLPSSSLFPSPSSHTFSRTSPESG